MFRTLTGYRPFGGDDALSAAVNHLTAPVPSFDEVVPELRIPRELELIVRRCLEKDAARRYPDAESLIADLEAFRRDEIDPYGEPTLPEPVARLAEPPPAPWLVGGALAVGILLGFGIGLVG